ncbi:MAG: oligosaccharide flippase family protein [Cyclobacteriaceae bacterium]|nr:oligosaccharide flippase family protein [Cyclobacteriaceae bacterium]
MNPIKKLAGETILYGLGTIVPRVFNFLLLPLHTAVFQPDDYGVITYLYAIAAFLNVVYLWGMETAYFRFATREPSDNNRIFNIALTTVIIISSTISLLLILFRKPVAHALQIENGARYIAWLAGIMWIDALVAIPFARLRLEHKPVRFAVAKIINVILLVLLNVYFLLYRYNEQIGVAYVFIANLLANAIFILFFIPWLVKWRPQLDGTISSDMFRYATPIMLTGIAGMTNEMFSRITLSWWLPENFYPGHDARYALGIFGACYKYAVFMNLAVQAFRYAAEPFFFSHATNKQAPELFARVNHYFVIVCSVILVAVSANLEALRFLLGDEQYYEGLVIVPALLLAYLFLGVYYNFSVWFKITDKTYFGTIFTVGGALITVVANYLLIPLYGYMGSTAAAVLCYAAMAAACYFIGQKYFPVPYRLSKSIAFIASALLFSYVINQPEFSDPWLAHIFHAAATVIFIAGVWLIERNNLKQLKRAA